MKDLQALAEIMSEAQLLEDAIFFEELRLKVAYPDMTDIAAEVRGKTIAQGRAQEQLVHAFQVVTQARVGFKVASHFAAAGEGHVYVYGRPHLKGMVSVAVLGGAGSVG